MADLVLGSAPSSYKLAGERAVLAGLIASHAKAVAGAGQITTKDVIGDGNCFFRAIEEQLARLNGGVSPMSYDELRKFSVEYIRRTPAQFEGFTDGQSIEDYLTTISRNGAWVDNPIIHALANELKIKIVIFEATSAGSATGRLNVVSADGAIRTVFLAHIPEFHYLSVLSIDAKFIPTLAGHDIVVPPDILQVSGVSSVDKDQYAAFTAEYTSLEGSVKDPATDTQTLLHRAALLVKQFFGSISIEDIHAFLHFVFINFKQPFFPYPHGGGGPGGPDDHDGGGGAASAASAADKIGPPEGNYGNVTILPGTLGTEDE